MSFPQTRHTLIQRIATGGDERAWQEFLIDYWGPVYRFALRWGQVRPEDAEDVAAQTFEALVQNQLLVRWASNRSAKLRTLLCTVVRNVLSNRARVQAGRARLLRDLVPSLEPPPEQVDAFYAAWVEDLLQQAVEGLLTQYHREGRGDYFRVLYGRLCDGMTMPEVARALGLSTTQAENAYKHARKRLAGRLEELVRAHVERYCAEGEAAGEFAAEWGRLGDYLRDHGGLEEAVRRAYETSGAAPLRRASSSRTAALTRMSEALRRAEPS